MIALKDHCSRRWFLVKCSQNLTQFSEVSNSSKKFLDSSRKSQTVLGSFKQFSEFLNSSRKFQTVLRSFKQFSEVSGSSRKFQTVLVSFKQFSEVSGSSRNSRTVLGSFKKFSEFLNSSRESQTVLGRLKQLPEVLNSSRNYSRESKKLLGFLKNPQCYQRAFTDLLRGVSEKQVLFNKIIE